MPMFVYFKAQNRRGYSCSIHWVPDVDPSSKPKASHIFQHHQITDEEAKQGTRWLESRYPVKLPEED